MTKSDLLKHFETQLEQLLMEHTCLKKDHQTLKAKEAKWAQERVRLVEKNEIAKTRVEAMITRLKNLELG